MESTTAQDLAPDTTKATTSKATQILPLDTFNQDLLTEEIWLLRPGATEAIAQDIEVDYVPLVHNDASLRDYGIAEDRTTETILDVPSVLRASTGSTFFQSTINDICTTAVGFKSHSMDIPSQSKEEFNIDWNINFDRFVNYNSHINEDFNLDEHPINDSYFLSTLENTGKHNLSPNFSVVGHYSKKDIRLITDCKFHKKYYT